MIREYVKTITQKAGTTRSKTGFRGVYQTGYKPGDPVCYQARITVTVNGRRKEILLYAGRDIEEAKAKREAAVIEYYGGYKEERKNE